jgi:antitoxin component YwqK of YwqJK toxin-antitoxin module
MYKFIRFILHFLVFGSFYDGLAQSILNKNEISKLYKSEEVLDADYGITMYNHLILSIGGDSVRYAKDRFKVNGWKEDFYENGSVLHKGFYVDGKIKIFKNYYLNGSIERNFIELDLNKSKLELFYEDGKQKSVILYYQGNSQNQYDYFRNGNPEYIEENDKHLEFLYKRNSYYENGIPESLFELIDKKQKRYSKKEFYINGKLKEEGFMIFRKDMNDYQKDGIWNYFDQSGKLTNTETYYKGELL